MRAAPLSHLGLGCSRQICHLPRVTPFFYPPSFELRAIVTTFARPLGELPPSPALRAALEPMGPPPVEVWRAVTELLHRFGRRPSHPRRPGGERVGLAARRGRLRSIDVAVDAANATALRSGLPVQVVDRARLRGVLRVTTTAKRARIAVGEPGATREVGGLPALADAGGLRVTPVAADAAVQTTPATRTTLSLLWGTATLGLDAAVAYHVELLTAAGGVCSSVYISGPADDPDAHARLGRVLADPADHAARLAFADWLDAHGGLPGHRRARLIREGLAGRRDYHLAEAVAVDAELAGWPLNWERGFVAAVGLDERFNPPLLPRFAREPVETVGIYRVEPASPVPATVHVLEVRNTVLRRVPHADPGRLRDLQLSGDPDADAWRWLAGLPALERLRMHINDATPWDLAITSPALVLLRLMGGRFASLAQLPVQRLTDLELHTNGLHDDLMRSLPPTPALEILRISKNAITTLAPFADARLRELNLWHVPLAAAEVSRILAMTGIEVLHVSACPEIERPLAAAINDGALPALRGLYGLVARRRQLEHGGAQT
jgi:uncharacterized protein (TIGR02996 family)